MLEESYIKGIATVSPDPDYAGCYLVKLSCGHEVFMVIEPVGNSLFCAQCLEEWLEKNRGTD